MLRDLQLSQVYKLIEPGPVVLLTTSRKECPNVMAMSWHMMMEFNPPLIACIVSGANHSFAALRETGECVIAIPTVELASLVVKLGNVSGSDMNKFETFGLSSKPAALVSAPLLTDCYVNLECKVTDAAFVRKYNLFVLEVVKAWIDRAKRNPKTIHHKGFGAFTVDGETLRMRSNKP